MNHILFLLLFSLYEAVLIEEHKAYDGEIYDVGKIDVPDVDIDMSVADDDTGKFCLFLLCLVA